MKKTIFGLAAILTLFSLASLVLAGEFTASSESIVVNTQDPAIISEAEQSLNNDVSGFDVFKERVKLGFTFSKEKRIERELKLASMLLNRARIAAKNNNTRAMEKAIDAHNRILEKVRNKVEEMNRKNMSSEKLVGIDRAIQVHEMKIERFELKLQNENLSDKQRENIEKMLNNSQNSIVVLRQLRELRETRREIMENMRRNNSEDKLKEIGEGARKKKMEEILNKRNLSEEDVQKLIVERERIRESVFNGTAERERILEGVLNNRTR